MGRLMMESQQNGGGLFPSERRMEPREALLLNPLQLAYMGDSVWEMMVRTRLIFQKKNVHHMHRLCVDSVNAAAQARGMEKLLPTLSEEELAVFQRGRNAHAKHPSPKNQDPADYAEATGFEALLGYFYLTGNEARLKEIEARVLEE